eukprot:6329398-Lingulodinium_polyedra.AAC.1
MSHPPSSSCKENTLLEPPTPHIQGLPQQGTAQSPWRSVPSGPFPFEVEVGALERHEVTPSA